MQTSFTAFLVSVLFVGLCRASWRDAPYDDDSFNTKQEFGANVTLRCTDERVENRTLQVVRWILPNLDIMKVTEEIEFLTLDGRAAWTVSADGLDMHITLVQEQHFGLYYCLVLDNATMEEFVVKRGMNYKGAYFGSLWDKYRLATIVSLGSSGGFVLAVIIMSVVYTMCSDTPQVAPDEDEALDMAYQNAAFSGDGSTTIDDVIPPKAMAQSINHEQPETESTHVNSFGLAMDALDVESTPL